MKNLNVLLYLIGVAVILPIWPAPQAPQQAIPDFSGAWILNAEKSKLPLKVFIGLVVKQKGDDLTETLAMNGNSVTVHYKIDSKTGDQVTMGAISLEATAHWKEKEKTLLIQWDDFGGSGVYLERRMTISPDGRTLTAKFMQQQQGMSRESLWVFDKKEPEAK